MSEHPNDDTPKTIGSVEKAFEIVEFVQERGEVGVTEIANALDRSKSSVHHYLTSLVEKGYLERTEQKY